MSSSPTAFKALNIAIIGAGLGGLSTALSLRRAGHNITIYERSSFAGEIGAGLSTASNGSKWLLAWGVDVEKAKPVIVKRLIMRKWGSGEVVQEAPMWDYGEKSGFENYAFHRIDIHTALLESCTSPSGPGKTCKITLLTDHGAVSISPEEGKVILSNGTEILADLIIGADGIRSTIRSAIGIVPEIETLPTLAYRCLLSVPKLRDFGLEKYVPTDALEFWRGAGLGEEIVVMGPCHRGERIAVYSFFPSSLKNDLDKDGWNNSATPQELISTFPTLDPNVKECFLHATDIKVWCLYAHNPYPFWISGRVALMGDAAHPMMPDQAQGFGQAIEDAAALRVVFGKEYFDGDTKRGLRRYESVRKGRATKIQDASLRARKDPRERIGWKTGQERVGKLTIEEVCGYDLEAHVRKVVGRENQGV